jgi:hypothetical protein
MTGPVRAQLSGHVEVSASDCQCPRLAASSGTRWSALVGLLGSTRPPAYPDVPHQGGIRRSEGGRRPATDTYCHFPHTAHLALLVSLVDRVLVRDFQSLHADDEHGRADQHGGRVQPSSTVPNKRVPSSVPQIMGQEEISSSRRTQPSRAGRCWTRHDVLIAPGASTCAEHASMA